MRLAIPRRVYTQSHMDYVVEAVQYVWRHRERLGGLGIAVEPSALRHFTCAFEPVGWDPLAELELPVRGEPRTIQQLQRPQAPAVT